MIYKNKELKCTEAELNDFIASINISYELRDFTQPYNNVQLKNQTDQDNAKYCIFSIEGNESLLKHVPFVQGFVAITEENAVEIIEEYKQRVIDNRVFSKFAVTEADKQEQRIAELEAAIASIVGGAM